MKNRTLDFYLGERKNFKQKYELVNKNKYKRKLYELPKNWKWKKLGDVVYIRRETIKPQKSPEEEFELYSIPAYHKTGKPVIKLGKEIRSTKFLVYPEDCLFGKLNPHIPKVWLVGPFNGRKQIASTESFPLVPKTKNIMVDLFVKKEDRVAATNKQTNK